MAYYYRDPLSDKAWETSEAFLRQTRDVITNKVKERPEFASEKVLDRFLVPEEELVPDLPPLALRGFQVWHGSNPWSERPLMAGDQSQLYLTNKRLFVVENGVGHRTERRRNADGTEVDINVMSRFGQSVIPFPLNNMYGINMRLEAKSIRTAKAKKVQVHPLLAVLLILTVIGIFILAMLSQVQVSNEEQDDTDDWRLTLITLDPLYMNRSSLILTVDHNAVAPDTLLRWVKELENKCGEIAEPAVFAKNMNV